MREVLFLSFIFIYVPLVGFSQHARNIKGKGYRGYIFSEHNNAFVGIEDQEAKFTPDLATVRVFEETLRENIGTLLHSVSVPSDGCPDIQKKLKRYVRQYFGFANSDGQRILYVNFVWCKNVKFFAGEIDSEYIQVLDGCSFYWNVKYNVECNEFYDLRVNPGS